MSKFKVGDRVKVTGGNLTGCCEVSQTDIYTVVSRKEIVENNDIADGLVLEFHDDKDMVYLHSEVDGGYYIVNSDATFEIISSSTPSFSTITLKRKKNKSIAVLTDSDGKFVKSEKAICNPSDTFDEEIGQKIAICRLMGIDKNFFQEFMEKNTSSVHEVKRRAKVGEYIKIVKKKFTFDKVGTILKVSDIDITSGFAGIKNTDYPYKVQVGSWHYSKDEYVVLENYNPSEQDKPFDITTVSDDELLAEVKRRLLR